MSKVYHNILTYTLPTVFSRISSLLILPIILSSLSTDNFGALEILVTVTSVLQYCLAFGWSSSFIRFLSVQEHNQHDLIITTLFFRFAIWIFAVFCLFILPLNQLSIFLLKSAAYSTLIPLCVFLFVLKDMALFLESIFRAQGKASYYMYFNLFQGFLYLILVFLLYYYHNINLSTILYAQIFSLLFPLLLFIVLECSCLLNGTFDISILRRILRFGLPLVPAALSIMVLSSTDQFMISSLYAVNPLSQVSLYALALKLVSLLSFFTVGFQLFWAPFFLKSYAEPASPAKFSLMFKLYFLLLSLVASIALALGLVLPKFFASFQSYSDFTYPLIFLIVGFIIYSVGDYFCIGIDIAEKNHYRMLYGAVAAIFNLSLNFVVIPSYGALGASFSTMLSYCLYSVLLLRSSLRYYPFRIPFHFILLLLLSVVPTYFAISHPPFAFILLSFYLLLLTVLLAYYYGSRKTLLSSPPVFD